MAQTARLFYNGKSQAVRLPKEFRFRGDKVIIKRLGNAVVLLPYHEPWQSLIESVGLFSEDYMEQREQPEPQCRPGAFQ